MVGTRSAMSIKTVDPDTHAMAGFLHNHSNPNDITMDSAVSSFQKTLSRMIVQVSM